jgi:hypothetical protein
MEEAPKGFGVMGAAPGVYRLSMPAPRSAELFEIMEDGTERQVSVAVCWSILADTVERDWNQRFELMPWMPPSEAS